MTSTPLRLALLLLVSSATACAGATEDTEAGLAEVNATSAKLARTERALGQLDAMRARAPIGQFYEGGIESTRVRACWANPAGRSLTDLQKALYCSVPLELRLCNSPVMLRNELGAAAAGDQNVTFNLNQGFKECQRSTEALFPGNFAWTAEIDDLYLNLFLRQTSGLTQEEEARIIAERKPTGGGLFPFLVLRTVSSLKSEATLFGHSLIGMVRDAQIEDPDASDL